MAISAADVKALRDKTGAPMMDLKTPLTRRAAISRRQSPFCGRRASIPRPNGADAHVRGPGAVQDFSGWQGGGHGRRLLRVGFCRAERRYGEVRRSVVRTCPVAGVQGPGCGGARRGDPQRQRDDDRRCRQALIGKISENVVLGGVARVTLPAGAHGAVGA